MNPRPCKSQRKYTPVAVFLERYIKAAMNWCRPLHLEIDSPR
jgi:hypothetical protein